METQSLIFLKEEIKERISGINQSRTYYRKIAFWAYLSITILSALTTIILGLNLKSFEEQLRIIALLLSGLITIISAYNSYFDNKQMWIANNIALNDFYKLNFDIEFAQSNSNITELLIEEYKIEYQNILDRLNSSWTNSRLK